MMLSLPALALFVLAAASSVVAKPIVATLETRSHTCHPEVAGKTFTISQGTDSHPTGFATLRNCIQAACTRVELAPPTDSLHGTDWMHWHASHPGQTSDSSPPLEIWSALSGGDPVTCWDNPTWGSQVSSRSCDPLEVAQKYVVTCEQCFSPFLDLGINCQIKSFDWGTCVASTGSGNPLSLVDCLWGDPAQTFNIIELNGKTA
ncbi:eukaryotic translation initiation factor 5A [Pseudohyphozyma bogoriensis]|nr:eukaryotic translation initiation factor 5A [Pseudohyphozyma bogoriensis]